MAKNKDLELRIVAKNLASKTIKGIGDDLKRFSSSTTSSMGGVRTAFTKVTGGITKIGSGLKSIGSASLNVASGMVSGFGKIFNAVFSVKTLIMGLFAGIIGKGVMAFVNLNAEFEKMKVTMDVLSKGQGEAWFNKLNQWALDMPVSMAEVSKAFITMQAYGLTPSIKMMENLVNVASVLPESGRAITGIARAIGQIQAKGRLEGQELRQLAEWAVPGYEAVYTKIFKKISERTGKAVSELKFTMIDAATANKAILETMEEHFGGAAKRIAQTWSGLTIRLTNYVKEFFRQIGEGGGMQPLKDQLENIVNFFEKAFKSGEMQKATSFIGKSFGIIFENLFNYFKVGQTDIKNWASIFTSVLEKIIYTVTIFVQTLSGIKLVLLTLKFVWIGVALIINGGLFAIIWAVNKVVEGFKFLVDQLPSWIPGVTSLQEAFSSFASTTGSVAEAQGENIAMLGQLAYSTGDDIAKTADNITNRWGLANKMITDLRTNLSKYEATQAVPPIPPTVTGGEAPEELLGFAKEIDETFKSLTGKQDKAFKPNEDYLKWLGEAGGLTTKLKIGFLEFEKEMDKNVLKNLKQNFKDFFGTIESGLSTAFQGILDGSMTLGDGIKSIFGSIQQAFFQMIANMAAEWVMGKAIMLTKEILFQKAVTAATAEGESSRLAIETGAAVKSVAIAVASGINKIMIYAYEAAAGAFKAIAGIPIIGPILAVGAGAVALGTVIGFAKKVASFEKGTGLEGVRNNGPAMLHKGEIVLNKKESDAYRAGANDGGGQVASNVTNVSFSISAMDGDSVERIVRKKILPLIRSNIRDNGIGRTMIREAT